MQRDTNELGGVTDGVGNDIATQRRAILAGVAGIAAGAFLTRGASAGPLNPPAGPVASTGKTLTEVEPRRAINQENTPGDATSRFRITQPGSYYLTGNTAGLPGLSCIKIEASDVTIDLMGFSIIGTPTFVDGIRTAGVRNNITIRNGSIFNFGGSGIDLTEAGAGNGFQIEGIKATNNSAFGIRVGADALVRNCVVRGNGSEGLTVGASSVVVECAAQENGKNGISVGDGCSVMNSASHSNTEAGFSSASSCSFVACVAFQNGLSGITVSLGMATDCVASFNQIDGITAGGGCSITNCKCNSNGIGNNGAGIRCFGSRNLVDRNTCVANHFGVLSTNINNFISGNICGANSVNFEIATGNVCFAVAGVTGGAISGNAGGVNPGTSIPTANFSF